MSDNELYMYMFVIQGNKIHVHVTISLSKKLDEKFFYTSLSTSSRRKTGLLTPTNRKPCIILPGMEPIYVLLCPLISDWSHTPPRAILQK